MKMVTLREASQKTGYNQTHLWQFVKAKKVKAGKERDRKRKTHNQVV